MIAELTSPAAILALIATADATLNAAVSDERRASLKLSQIRARAAIGATGGLVEAEESYVAAVRFAEDAKRHRAQLDVPAEYRKLVARRDSLRAKAANDEADLARDTARLEQLRAEIAALMPGYESRRYNVRAGKLALHDAESDVAAFEAQHRDALVAAAALPALAGR